MFTIHKYFISIGWFIFFFGPVTLIIFGFIPFELRFYMLVTQTLLAAVIAFPLYKSKSLGFRLDTLAHSLIINSIIALCFLCFLALATTTRLVNRQEKPDWKFFYMFYVFVSCPCQEFLYRCVIAAELDRVKVQSWLARITILSVPYAYMHLIYHDATTVALTFVIGIIWAIAYTRAQNFCGVTLSHIILGIVTIYLGIV